MTISEVKRMARVTEWKGLIQEQKQSGSASMERRNEEPIPGVSLISESWLSLCTWDY